MDPGWVGPPSYSASAPKGQYDPVIKATVNTDTKSYDEHMQLSEANLNYSCSTHGQTDVQQTPSNGHENTQCYDDDYVPVNLRKHPKKELRHAYSDVQPENPRRRSQTMTEAKEHAVACLQRELDKAQTDLKLKDEECEKLLKVRDQMGEELEELTASLFEEANNMVQEANIKRINTEKHLHEANQKVEILEAEVIALKQLVLTSTPSSPNKHLHPQICINNSTEKKKDKEKDKEKGGKPFWKTHRRSTSHHEFTKEARQEAEAQQEAKIDRCNEIDPVCMEEFKCWRLQSDLGRSSHFLSRIIVEDIWPCLNFSNSKLAERVQCCVEDNNIAIEPIPGDNSYPRKCSLTETHRLCNYKIRLGDDSEWYSISQHCRNRIAAVCDFYTYIRYIHQGLVKAEDKDVFYEIVRLRKQMALARLGYI